MWSGWQRRFAAGWGHELGSAMTTAVVLYNLGGPDAPSDVRPFLFNLFNDPMIITAPAPIRWALAKLISSRRAPIAQEIYSHLGGGSPLLANTRAQADALEEILNADLAGAYKCFVAMRYWHPMVDVVMDEVIATAPDQIILLPLYPQFSTTTVGSVMRVWQMAAKKRRLDIPVKALCCYPTAPGFVSTVAGQLSVSLDLVECAPKEVRVLFSAHGLPKKIIAGGDPYQSQVEKTAAAVMKKLDSDLDWLCCYQSRVGPLEWIGPSTEDEIARAGADGKTVIVVPIAFVSEHSETLVELDIEYRDLAAEVGVPEYIRVPTAGTSPDFIAGLADMVRGSLAAGCKLGSGDPGAPGGRICMTGWSKCPAKCAAA